MARPCLFSDMYLDTVTRRNHSDPLAMTSDPIEDGSLIAEHVAPQIETLTLDVSLTDDAFAYYGPDDAAIKAANKVTSKNDKKQYLKSMKGKREIIDIIFDDEVFFNFVLLDILADETAENFYTYDATLICQKAVTYETLNRKVPLSKIRKKKVQAKTEPAIKQEETEDGGEVAIEKPASDAETKSTLAGAVDALRGFL